MTAVNNIRPATARTGAPSRPAINTVGSASEVKPEAENKKDETPLIADSPQIQPQKTTSINNETQVKAALERDQHLDMIPLMVAGVATNLLSMFRPGDNAGFNNIPSTTTEPPPNREQETKPIEPLTREDLVQVPLTSIADNPEDSQRAALRNNFEHFANHKNYGQAFQEAFRGNATRGRFEMAESGRIDFDQLAHIPNDKMARLIMYSAFDLESDKVMPEMFNRITDPNFFAKYPDLAKDMFAHQEAKGGLALNPSRSLDIGFGDGSGIEF